VHTFYYYAQGDQRLGPVPAEQLPSLGVRAETLVWAEGMAGWVPAGSHPPLQYLCASPAAYAPPASAMYAATAQGTTAGYAGVPGVSPLGYSPAFAGAQYGQGSSPVPGNGEAIGSLVCGIMSIVLVCGYGIGLVLGIIAVVLGHRANAAHRRATGYASGMAVGGLVCGYIGGAISLVWVVLMIFVLTAFGR
jgi:hypothetical protein